MSEFAPNQGPVAWSQNLHYLWQNEKNLTKVQSELGDAISQRSRTPGNDTRLLQEKDAEIERLKAELAFHQSNASLVLQRLSQQDREIYNQNIRIQQQERTIRVHSAELSKAQDRQQPHHTTPSHERSHFTTLGYSGSSPFHETPVQNGFGPPLHSEVALPPGYHTQWGSFKFPNASSNPDQTLVVHQPSISNPAQPFRGGADRQGSPFPVNQMRNMTLQNHVNSQDNEYRTPPRGHPASDSTGSNNYGTPATSTEASGRMFPPVSPQTPVQRTESAMSRPRSMKDAVIPYSTGTREDELSKKLAVLFDEAVDFAYTFANFPSNAADKAMPQHIKDILMSKATQTTAFRLMQSQQTRYWLVAKVILGDITDVVFGVLTFVGLDASIDETVAAIRQKLRPNTPNEIRRLYLREITEKHNKLRNHPAWEDFTSRKAWERANALWSIVHPIMHRRVPGDFERLQGLMKQAYSVAELRFTDAAEYQIYFPVYNQMFDANTMVNFDQEYRSLSSGAIAARDLHVRLGAMPHVTRTTIGEHGVVNTKALCKAAVLLKDPPPNRNTAHS